MEGKKKCAREEWRGRATVSERTDVKVTTALVA